MKRKRLNLVFAFLISFCLHAAAVGFVVYGNFKDSETNISKNDIQKAAFGLNFAQIADINTDHQAASKSEEISHTAEEMKPPVEEVDNEVVEDVPQDVVAENIDNDSPVQEPTPQPQPPKPKKKIKKIKQNKQPKPEKIIEKKHVCEHCVNREKKLDEPTDTKAYVESMVGSNTQANNDVNSIGGSKSSGSSDSRQDGGSNLNGEIYAAIKKHTTYPKRALERKIEGRTVVEFKQLNEDEFEYINVIESSGFKMLDLHAIKIVKSARKSLPKASYNLSIKVPITFDINNF